MVENPKVHENKKQVSWKYKDTAIEIEFNFIIRSVVVLKYERGVAIVTDEFTDGPNNAYIYDIYGNLLFRLSNPEPDAMGFYEIYYIYNELVAIIATASGDFRYTIDLDTGLLRGKAESR